MRVEFSPTSVLRLALRCLPALLSLVLIASQAPGLFCAGSGAVQASTASSGKHKKTHQPEKYRATSPAHKASNASGASPTRKTRQASKAGHAFKTGRVSQAEGNAGTRRQRRRRPSKAVRRAQTARIKRAFVASAELRPMAQQLATLRTPAAYVGVTEFAQRHSGAAAAAAYLALGHAYLLDKRYAEAIVSLHLARQAGDELADYADFLGARAEQSAGDDAAAEALLRGFAQRYPDSIFVNQTPELEANLLLSLNDVAGARRVLVAAEETGAADRPGYQLAEGQVAFTLGETEDAARIDKQLLLTCPLSPEAQIARARLASMGQESSLTASELSSLGDAYYKAGRYESASEQYRALTRQPDLSEEVRDRFAVAAAACDLKLKRLTTAEAEALPDTNDESGARRLYLLMELARNQNDLEAQRRIVAEMESRFPASPWLAEALYSSGNLYLLRSEYPAAVAYYGDLAARFPASRYAARAHWRAAWLTYRQGLYSQAARLFDEQIRLYPSVPETASALYWRGRLYETQGHSPALAVADYRTLIRAYRHYFFAQMASRRLAALGDAEPVSQPELSRFQPPPVPRLVESFPADSPHLARARLLANAGLNEYIGQEIAADPDSASWSALAEAQIYASYGENFRALRAIKRALPHFASAPIQSIPLVYWRILFPEPYWETIKAESAKNGLDPYLVASLIRQESEFNPSVVSYANAYGLMQLLPAVGKTMARQEGMRSFETFQLLDPVTNIRLGTRYLRQQLDKFGGVPEYALAAYNAGSERVADWKDAGPYQGMDEFVESIPFTETREYVESILRNVEMYKEIDALAEAQDGSAASVKGQ
jgi:soluble lytic murein transglycosylase